MTPFENRELQSHTEANMRGRLRVQKLEKELSALTSSAMKYKSFYSKSASQMAKEAIEASESEAAASRKVRKTTIHLVGILSPSLIKTTIQKASHLESTCQEHFNDTHFITIF